MEGGEASDVRLPEIHGRAVRDDPLREGPPRSARRRDATRAEARPDVVAAHLGRFAQDEVVVRREALRPVHQETDLGRLERGHPLDGIAHEDLELAPVFRERSEAESLGDTLHAPGLGPGIEAAHEESRHLFLEVDVAVAIAHHGQIGGDAVDGVGDDVHVLAGVQGYGDAAHAAELARPHARAVHQDFRGDVALRGVHSRHAAALELDARDLDALVNLRTARPGAPGEGLGDVGGVRLAVAGNPHRPHEVIGAHERVALARLLGADLLGLDAVGAGHRGVASELDHALDRARHADAAAALPARGLARLGLEAAVEIDAVANELGQIARGAELAHEAGGVPRGPSREAPLLEHDHVTPSQRGQVIGDAGTDDATADDDDARLARKRGHRERLRARSKMSKLRRRRPGGRSPRRSVNTSGTVCSDSPPWERRGASSPERSCLARLVPMT